MILSRIAKLLRWWSRNINNQDKNQPFWKHLAFTNRGLADNLPLTPWSAKNVCTESIASTSEFEMFTEKNRGKNFEQKLFTRFKEKVHPSSFFSSFKDHEKLGKLKRCVFHRKITQLRTARKNENKRGLLTLVERVTKVKSITWRNLIAALCLIVVIYRIVPLQPHSFLQPLFVPAENATRSAFPLWSRNLQRGMNEECRNGNRKRGG